MDASTFWGSMTGLWFEWWSNFSASIWIHRNLYVFLINGSTLIAGWFIRENTVKIDNFAGTPISGTPHTVPLIKVMVQSVFPVNNTVFLYIYVAQTYVFPIKIVNTDQ
jgi:hypothetical protein